MEEENGLLFMRERYYDSSIGRFIKPDPLGSLRGYIYGANNPVIFIDPLGLLPIKWVGEKAVWVWEHIYIDVGESAFVPPSVFLPVGEEAGIVIVPSRGEVYIYGGGGAGAGGGASATLNLGNPPTEGWSSKLTGTLGGGLGIKYTQSEKGQSVGVGIGIEASVKGTKTYYKKIIDINLRKKKKGDK